MFAAMRQPLLLSFFILVMLAGCSSETSPIYTITNPAGNSASLPRLFTDNTGTVFMSWVEVEADTARFKFAGFNGAGWSSPSTIASGTSWFLNWADFPSLIAANSQPFAAHWLHKIPGNSYSYNIEMATFGEEWSSSIIPHTDNTATEHGFVSMLPATDSTFLAIWLDGRNTAGRAHHQYSDISKAMTLRGAFIQAGTFPSVIQEFALDPDICDCCHTTLVKTENGYLAAYRNRTADEVRDIYTVRYENGTWTGPAAIHDDNWQISACPVNGPAAASFANYVAVAWFTGADDMPRIKLSISTDNGARFGEPIIIEEISSLGRVDVEMNSDKIWLSWMNGIGDEASLQIQAFDLNGNKVAAYSIPGLAKSRNTGFPQITLAPGGLMVALTDISAEKPSVKTYFLPFK